MTRITMEVKLTRDELLMLANKALSAGDDQRAQLFMWQAAKFSVGDHVRHVDDGTAAEPGVIIDGPRLIGWPEHDPNDPTAIGLVYEVASGPVETFDIPENQLIEVDES